MLRNIIRKQAPTMNHRGRKRLEKACVEREKHHRQSQRVPILTVRLEAEDVWQNQKAEAWSQPSEGDASEAAAGAERELIDVR